MSLFAPATNDQAYLKAGFFGQTGSGKTYTTAKLIVGFHQHLASLGLPEGENPVLFMDTETGSAWIKRLFDEEGILLEVAKTRAFRALVPSIFEAEERKCILWIDSLTHFWKELIDTFLTEKRRDRIFFPDWQFLKGPKANGAFSEAFVNSSCHIVWCARAGFEYEFREDDRGDRNLERTGIKPKSETESGYEPSLLVLMSRHQKFDLEHPEKAKTIHYASVLKDRGPLDGKVFENPTFENFLPHVECLELGGKQVGVDTEHTSAGIIPPDSGEGRLKNEQKDIALDEIKELLVKHHPGRAAAAVKTKGDLLEEAFGTRSWVRVESMKLEPIQVGRNKLWEKLEKKPYQWDSEPVGTSGVVTNNPEELDAKVKADLDAEFEKDTVETSARTAGLDADLPF